MCCSSPLRVLIYEPPRWLWAGTEGAGLWLSPDEGVTWSFAGLAGRTVYTLQFQQQLLAATDRGIWAVPVSPDLFARKVRR